jgi:SAM-dependent methyltransferase
MSKSKDNEYVLGTNDAELARLGLQHRLWSRQAFDLWERAGIGPGARVLDVGCGPGHATFDIAQLVTQSGRVIAVDESERFVHYLAAQAEVRGVINVEASVQDVQSLKVPAGSVDFAYARWVLCFTPRPGDVVAGVARALKPGGRFLVQDYTHWQGLFLSPADAAFLEVIRATDEAWRGSGGDSEIGKRLPGLMEQNGLVVESIRPLQRIARPHEPLWQWPSSFFANWVPRLVEEGYLQGGAHRAFVEAWDAHSRDPNAFFWTPAMVEVIGRRPETT